MTRVWTYNLDWRPDRNSKRSPYTVMKAQKGSAGNLGAIRGWVVNATLRPLYSQEQSGTHWYRGLGDRKSTFAKIHNPIRPKCRRFNIQLLATVYRSAMVVICGRLRQSLLLIMKQDSLRIWTKYGLKHTAECSMHLQDYSFPPYLTYYYILPLFAYQCTANFNRRWDFPHSSTGQKHLLERV
jgi:hypothetical protein